MTSLSCTQKLPHGHKMRMMHLRSLVLLVLLPAIFGCEESADQLHVQDLTDNEFRYVERVVVLERAKAFALVYPDQGIPLLDSLGIAWGDSALEKTLIGLPNDPIRAAAVNDLLLRLLEAEEDSLKLAPRFDRVSAPLPNDQLVDQLEGSSTNDNPK